MEKETTDLILSIITNRSKIPADSNHAAGVTVQNVSEEWMWGWGTHQNNEYVWYDVVPKSGAGSNNAEHLGVVNPVHSHKIAGHSYTKPDKHTLESTYSYYLIFGNANYFDNQLLVTNANYF